MRICYLFNSSVPSHNPSSLQAMKTCEGLVQIYNKVFIITPNTGLDLDIKKYYKNQTYTVQSLIKKKVFLVL